jgi:hypothetical protein
MAAFMAGVAFAKKLKTKNGRVAWRRCERQTALVMGRAGLRERV